MDGLTRERMVQVLKDLRTVGKHHHSNPECNWRDVAVPGFRFLRGTGICHNVHVNVGDENYEASEVMLSEAFKDLGLPTAYVVPSPFEGETPEEAYDSCFDKWTGAYGKLRLDLLDTLIDYYSEAL